MRRSTASTIPPRSATVAVADRRRASSSTPTTSRPCAACCSPPFEISIPRGASRGYGDPDPSAPSNRRYVEGQRLYLERCHPERHATIVIDNSVLAEPEITADRSHSLG
jgi:hypothetical protein